MVCSIIQPGSETFGVHCFERDYDAFSFGHSQVQHELTKNGKPLDQAEFKAALKKEVESGRLKVPTHSAVGFQMRGPAKAFDWNSNTPSAEIKHWEMIMMPNATGASLSLPTSRPANGGPWVMGDGTPGAHIHGRALNRDLYAPPSRPSGGRSGRCCRYRRRSHHSEYLSPMVRLLGSPAINCEIRC